MRSIAGYVTKKKRKTDRKETQKKLKKKLFEENLNRL
jgi:ribosomal protein S17E